MFLICRSIRATEWHAAKRFRDQTHPISQKCGLKIGHPCKGFNSSSLCISIYSFLVQKVNYVYLFVWWKSFQVYGIEPYIRSAENIAFHAALFVAKNGSYINYYMVTKLRSLSNRIWSSRTHHRVSIQYHGGTNFGRTSSSYFITGYYDQAPLDEYGLV